MPTTKRKSWTSAKVRHDGERILDLIQQMNAKGKRAPRSFMQRRLVLGDGQMEYRLHYVNRRLLAKRGLAVQYSEDAGVGPLKGRGYEIVSRLDWSRPGHIRSFATVAAFLEHQARVLEAEALSLKGSDAATASTAYSLVRAAHASVVNAALVQTGETLEPSRPLAPTPTAISNGASA